MEKRANTAKPPSIKERGLFMPVKYKIDIFCQRLKEKDTAHTNFEKISYLRKLRYRRSVAAAWCRGRISPVYAPCSNASLGTFWNMRRRGPTNAKT